MKIRKTFDVIAPREEVWEFMTSPTKMVPCMPGCEHVEEVAHGQYKAVLKVSAGPIRTSFSVAVETTGQRAPEFASYRIKGHDGGKASRLNAESTVLLEVIDHERTDVTYTSHVNVLGRLGRLAGGVMNKIADSMGDRFIAAVRAELESEGARLDREDGKEETA